MPTTSQQTTSLLRRIVRRARRELAGVRRTTVGAGTAARQLRGQRLRLVLPDPSALVRLATSGQLSGQVSGVDLHLATVPDQLLAGLRPPRLGRTAARFDWRRQGRRLRVRLRWSRPYEVSLALADLLRAVLRARAWEQTSGPVFALDPAACLAGRATWPQGQLVARPPAAETDEHGRPLGPYLPAPPPAPAAPPPVVTVVAHPYGRTLVGAATRYQLVRAGGRLVLREPGGPVVDPAAAHRYAVAEVADVAVPVADDDLLWALAAGGMVFAAPDPAVRTGLAGAGLVTVADAAAVTDLAGYGLSVAASRRATIAGDAALRRTALAGDGAVALPAVTAIVATRRPECLDTLVGYLAGQDYPALEVVIGLHGYGDVDRERLTKDLTRDLARDVAKDLPMPVRVVSFPAGQPLGMVLGQLTRLAGGDLVTKLDDDDHYGPHHVTDLVLAWHTSGADLVAKGARFVHFPERDETIDRAWAAPEVFDVTPAGGTLLLSRGTLAQAGGWSHSSKHVDADLLARIRGAGGLVYRTHALEYVYVRRSGGHTFVTGVDELLAHGERTYPGLPAEIIYPDRAAVPASRPG